MHLGVKQNPRRVVVHLNWLADQVICPWGVYIHVIWLIVFCFCRGVSCMMDDEKKANLLRC